MKSLFLLTLAAILGACTMQDKSDGPAPKIISLETSSCFGKCAEQKLTINKKGEMNFDGIKNVQNLGNYRSELSKEAYSKLLAQFETAKFSEMDSTYLSGLKDIQKITISLDNQSVIFHERNASGELKGLYEELNKLITNSSWTEY